jgi:2-polyprenyl-3-methyl-5-hydroxy-6-metoxy-1,4-benzoquinol methylase
MTNPKMKILVAIASYGTRNERYLSRVLEEYRSMPYTVDIVVLSNLQKELGPDVEVKVGLPIKNPWSLPFGHKQLFADRLNSYDLFIYSEDDILYEKKNIDAFMRVSAVLPEDEIPGFLLYESAPDGTRNFPQAHGRFHWDPFSVRQRGREMFASFTNEHSACYAITQDQLRRAIASGGFLVPPHEGKYDMLCSAATDPYTQCGMRNVLCLSAIDDFMLHHLPDKYIGKFGVNDEKLHKQIDRLLELNGRPGEKIGRLPTESKLNNLEFCKTSYEPAREEIVSLIPRTVKTILSLGCGLGKMEARLAEVGFQVTAVPLDPVISAGLEDKGVKIVFGDFQEARKKLSNRKFDCLVVSNMLHLVQDPAALLSAYGEILSDNAMVIATVPKVSKLAIMRTKEYGDYSIWELSSFEKTGLNLTSTRVLSNWYESAGVRPQKMITNMAPNRKKVGRLAFGIADPWLATELIAVGIKR